MPVSSGARGFPTQLEELKCARWRVSHTIDLGDVKIPTCIRRILDARAVSLRGFFHLHGALPYRLRIDLGSGASYTEAYTSGWECEVICPMDSDSSLDQVIRIGRYSTDASIRHASDYVFNAEGGDGSTPDFKELMGWFDVLANENKQALYNFAVAMEQGGMLVTVTEETSRDSGDSDDDMSEA